MQTAWGEDRLHEGENPENQPNFENFDSHTILCELFALEDLEKFKLNLSIWFLEMTTFKEVRDCQIVSIFSKIVFKMQGNNLIFLTIQSPLLLNVNDKLKGKNHYSR